MKNTIYLQMMGEFVIRTPEKEIGALATRTRKGVALMEYLILNYGKEVPKQRLLNVLWTYDLHVNPENALKTLVSRLRKILNAEMDGLGACIHSSRGSYSWRNLPGMKVDLLELISLFEQLHSEKQGKRKSVLYRRLMELYKGDLFLTGDIEGGVGYEAALHSEYLDAVYDYIEFLRAAGEFDLIVEVCRQASRIDRFDERLQLEMMQALVDAQRTDEAVAKYNQVQNLSERHLGVPVGEAIRDFYSRIARSGDILKNNMDSIRQDLNTESRGGKAFLCDYDTFRNYCQLERFNLERLGCTLFFGLIMLFSKEEAEDPGPRVEAAMRILTDILEENLRKGDVIVRYASTTMVVLLPTVNHTTGNMIMERIRQMFTELAPEPDIPYHYRLEELS